MAQKREKEETELKVPETSSLCSPPISAAAPPNLSATDDRRSSPDRSDLTTGSVSDVIVEKFRSSSASSPEKPDLTNGAVSDVIVEKYRSSSASSPEKPDLTRKRRLEATETSENSTETVSKKRVVNRCSGCRKKVGLIGFTCRCGEMFCSEHRYSDRHDCSYDYKAAGREAIARENPVVRAAKILKV